MATEGRKRVRAALDGATPVRLVRGADAGEELYGLPPGCPITPLGFSGKTRFYLDSRRQLVELEASEHVNMQLRGLFGGSPEARDFPYSVARWTRHNAEGIVTGLRPELIAEDLMTACGEAGAWDASERVRGRGAWRGQDGELILHLGHRLMVFEPGAPDVWRGRQVLKPGRHGRYVYPSAEETAGPAEDAEPDPDAAEEVLELLDTWRWLRGDLDAVLMLGWIGAAMIAGALKWRPAVWLTGRKGTGKSTLQDFIKLLLGDALLNVADGTAASIWQTLGHQTLPVSVDELEADEDNRKQLAVVKLARLAASGGRLLRGSDRHKAVEFTLRSCFQFGSVLVPPLMGPDRSRIALLELHDLEPGAPVPDLSPRRWRPIGAQLRRQLAAGWGRFEQTLEYYRRALARRGHSARGADQFGTLFACADLLLFPGDTDTERADGWLGRMEAAALAETADDQNDEQACFKRLLEYQPDAYRGGDKASLGEWINRAAGRDPGWNDTGEAVRIIGRHGLRVERLAGRWLLAIANGHRGLELVFTGTRWQTPAGAPGVWSQSLRRLEGAERGQKTMYFGGSSSKATLLPLELVPEPDLQQQLPLT